MPNFCNCQHEERIHTISQACLSAGCRCRKYSARPLIVCLCGSTRFHDAFVRSNFDETMRGHIVLSVGFFANATPEEFSIREHGELIGITPDQKLMLDRLHKRKIDLADEVLVLNVGGYVGESTRSEIEYAEKTGKLVRYLETVI